MTAFAGARTGAAGVRGAAGVAGSTDSILLLAGIPDEILLLGPVAGVGTGAGIVDGAGIAGLRAYVDFGVPGWR